MKSMFDPRIDINGHRVHMKPIAEFEPLKETITTPWTVVGVFFAALAVIAVCSHRDLGPYDEGLILTGAAQVMKGAIPHRDFYANYGPAQFYILAGLFKLFGPSVLVERLWDGVAKAAAVACIFLIGERLTTRKWSLLSSTLCMVWLSYIGMPGWPVWPALFVLMLGSLLLFGVFEKRSNAVQLFSAGACVGLATLFRYDIGFLAWASQTTVLLAYCLSRKTESKARLHSSVAILLPFWGGTAVILAPVAFFFLLSGAIGDFWFDVVSFPTHSYAAMRGLPFPAHFFSGLSVGITDYIVYLPVAAVICAIAALASIDDFAITKNPNSRTEGNSSESMKWKLGLLIAVMLAFYAKAYVRMSAVHVGLALMPCFIVLTVIASAYAHRRPTLLAAGIGIAVVAGAVPTLRAAEQAAATAFGNITWAIRTSNTNPSIADAAQPDGSCRPRQGLERVACFEFGEDQTKAVLYLQARLPLGEPIFVGLPRHDKIFANDVGFYFVSKFRPMTKWYHFDPGLQTDAAIQRLIIGELEQSKPKYIVLDSGWENKFELNGSAISSGVVLLDDYIRGHFRRAASFGSFTVLERT
jgi:Dolichyl-phosphate-mannose-protein mannosyltransferase